ncbi:MAG: transcription termination factor NusA [Dehalococcoidia bacterium]|jgi:N utilization substance protein A|nr:transcription termination factor NusA [Dehalococcoidia bacterium]
MPTFLVSAECVTWRDELKSDLLLAVTQLAAERNLPQPIVVKAVEAALASAYKRDPAAQGQDVIVEMDPVDGDVIVRTVRHVVEEVEDALMELTADDAQELQEGAVVGDIIETGQLEYNPGRIAAQTAKQVVMQRLREAERDIVFEEFIDKEGEVLTATVQRVESRWVTVDLGKAEAVMPPTEQSPFERYRPGQQLKFFVVQVGRTIRGPEIIVSRTHPDLLRRLFEVEVPEIFNGVIEIKAIAREPGARSKVAVSSNQEGVDAVGACVGLRGIRIQNVVNELLGEKIDVIEWDEDPIKFISNSLSPAVADRVDLNEEEESALVLVPERQLSLAIGREGQNVRLGAKLTNWRIDIEATTSVVEDEVVEPEAPQVAEIEQVESDAEAGVAEPAISETETPEETPVIDSSPDDSSDQVAESVDAIEEPADGTEEESASDVVAVEEESADVAAELLALEEELAALEREEQQRKETEDAAILDVSSDDLWQVDSRSNTPSDSSDTGGIRFAEDISGFRETDQGRQGGRRGGSSARNRRRR